MSSSVTLVLAFILLGVLGLLGALRQRLSLALSFPCKLLLSELQKSGFGHWKRSLQCGGKAREFFQILQRPNNASSPGYNQCIKARFQSRISRCAKRF